MRVALLGTGTMGAGMARTLRREGFDVVAWNRTREKAEPLTADGIAVVDDAADAVSGADVVVTMVYDLDAVLALVPAVADNLGTDSVWLQCSTIGPQGIARLVEVAGGVPMVDAPVLGTKQPAAEGKLVPLVSGPAALIDRVRPVLDALGTKTVVVGEQLGQGSALKLAANAWVASLTTATAQSLALAAALDVDPALFLEAISGGPSDTPYAQLKGKLMLAEDWTPSFGLDGLAKDVDLMLEAGGKAGMRTEVLQAIRGLLGDASDAGHGADDIAAVRTAF